MGINRSPVHLDDELLVAFMDGEISANQKHSVEAHLENCWKCRSALTDLESRMEEVSRLLTITGKAEIDRSVAAKERFLRWRRLSEDRGSSFRRSMRTHWPCSVMQVTYV